MPYVQRLSAIYKQLAVMSATALLTAFGIFCFEWIEHVLFPPIARREPHFVTIACSGILAGTVAAAALLRQRTCALSRNNEELRAEIAERKRAETELAFERLLLNALLDSCIDSIYFKDRESRFIRSSEIFAKALNLNSRDEIIGKTDFDFFTKEHAQQAFHDEQEIIRTGKPLISKAEKETWVDGRVTWALTSKMPLRNVSGEIIGTFGISKDITAIKETEARLESAHKQLLETSRRAGMAEVATSVLHNVGNVLNSVNISCSVISDKLRKSRISSVAKTAELLRERAGDIAAFFTSDPAGQKLPDYLAKLSARLAQEQTELLTELQSLAQNVEHIKEIVEVQQSHAKDVGGVRETLLIEGLVEDALRMNMTALARHHVEVVREYAETPPLPVEKHKVLQILINLISNAKHSLSDSGRADKRLIVRIGRHDGHVAVSFSDNGIGIAPENATRIFAHGFTTKKNGHGFGLHSGVLAAEELGGRLTAHSDGIGHGATFRLELPLNTHGNKPEPIPCTN